MPINNLNILNPLKHISHIKGKSAESVSLKLTGGEIIKGLVIDTFPKNKVLVRINGQKVLAETKTSLKAGETLNLRVESGPPKIVLNILESSNKETTTSNKIPSHIKGLISEKRDIKDLYNDILKLDLNKSELNSILGQKLASKLRTSIESSTLKGEQTPENIKNLIKDSGLMFEGRFKEFIDGNITKMQLLNGVQKDIKGTLLEISKVLKDKITLNGQEINDTTLKNFASDVTGKSIGNITKNENLQLKTVEASRITLETLKNISKNVNRFIDNIEIDQLSNIVSKEKNGGFSFNIPFLNNDNIDNARLYAYKRDGKNQNANKNQDKFYLVLFLNMKKVGDIRVDINVDKKNITTNFSLANKTVSEFFESHKDDLIKNLKDYNTNIGFGVRENINETEEELKKDFSLNNMRILDVRV